MTKHLRPIALGVRPALADDDSARPAWVPTGAALDAATDARLDRLGALHALLRADGRRALLVVVQGRDASGKDGAIRRVCAALDPQALTVARFETPTPLEARHDFLWRAHAAAPARGTVAVFNRSHYEDVLIARVRALVPRDAWERRYAQINAFEQLLSDAATTIVKLHVHVSQAEQRRRFLARVDDPEKQWKFRESDLDDRALWDGYTAAYQDALARCSTAWAPWYVVPADDKRARDYLVADTLVRALERLDLRPPTVDDATATRWRERLSL